MNTILNVGWRLMLCTFPQLVGLGHNSVYSFSPEQFETQFKTKYAVEVDDVFFPDQLDLNFTLFKLPNNKKEDTDEDKIGNPKKTKGWDAFDTLGDLMVSSSLYLFSRIYL